MVRESSKLPDAEPLSEAETLDAFFGSWSALRDAAESRGEQTVEVPSSLGTAPSDDDEKPLVKLFASGRATRLSIERILHEATEDAKYIFEEGEWELWPQSVHALNALLESSLPLTDGDREAIFRLAVAHYDHYGIPSFAATLREKEWFQWGDATTILFAKQWPDGEAYLEEVREGVDSDVWDALAPTWRRTVKELKEACKLV